MALPELGTYKNEDQQFTITITHANASIGQITGTYQAHFSPYGPIEKTGKIGTYAWVSNRQGVSGGAPFSITFSAVNRPAGRPHCIIDHWNGAYLEDGTLLLTGTRGFVNNKGEYESQLIATSKFTKVS